MSAAISCVYMYSYFLPVCCCAWHEHANSSAITTADASVIDKESKHSDGRVKSYGCTGLADLEHAREL